MSTLHPPDAQEVVELGLDGKLYEVALSAEDADQLRKAIQPYVVRARDLPTAPVVLPRRNNRPRRPARGRKKR